MIKVVFLDSLVYPLGIVHFLYSRVHNVTHVRHISIYGAHA